MRHPGERFIERHEEEWPLKRTEWTKFYLNPVDASLSTVPQTKRSSITYAGFSEGVTFMTPPLDKKVEITGPIAQGWLRSSHRKLDGNLTLPYRPYHTHGEEQQLEPGKTYEVDVEVWPTCIVFPRSYRIALPMRGTDYVYPGDSSAKLGKYANWTSCGIFPS